MIILQLFLFTPSFVPATHETSFNSLVLCYSSIFYWIYFLCLKKKKTTPHYSWTLPIYPCFSRLQPDVTSFGSFFFFLTSLIKLGRCFSSGFCLLPECPSSTHLIYLWILSTGSDDNQVVVYVGKLELTQKVILGLTSWSSYDIRCLQEQILAMTISVIRQLGRSAREIEILWSLSSKTSSGC